LEYASSTNGPINISKIKGNPSLLTTNGPISVDSVSGYVIATSTNGRINIVNSSGVGDVSTTNGAISVEILDFLDEITIQTTNGGITVFIDSNLNASVKISTVNGGITVGDFVDVTESTSKTFEGIIGSGGNIINIKTTNGGIKVFRLTE
jgi:DUF4097 and DUF4098 domain-containing protein YvlB